MPPARAGVPLPHFTATQELFRAGDLTLTAGSDTVTADTANEATTPATPGGLVDVSSAGNGLLVVSVGAVSGTTPQLAVFFDVEDGFGNWALVSDATSVNGAAITAAGTYSGSLSTATVAAYNGRVRWTVSGTDPSFSDVSFTIFGR